MAKYRVRVFSSGDLYRAGEEVYHNSFNSLALAQKYCERMRMRDLETIIEFLDGQGKTRKVYQ
jgi:hypothetical protein